MTDKYNTQDLLAYALDQKPLEFNKTFVELLKDKLVSAVEAKKRDLAQSMFEPVEIEDQDDENEEDLDQEEPTDD